MKLEPYTRRELFEQIPDLENKTVLDLGSGAFCLYGLTYLDVLGPKLGKDKVDVYKNNVVAVDLEYDPSFGSFLNGTSLIGDVKFLPLQDKKFNIVAAGRIFNYFRKNHDQLSGVLNEIDRVLKQDGYLIGDTTLFPSLSPNKILRILKFTLFWESYMWQIEDYSKLMEQRGFKFLRKGIGFIPDEITNSLKMFFVTRRE